MIKRLAMLLIIFIVLPATVFAEEPIIEEIDVDELRGDVDAMQTAPAKDQVKARKKAPAAEKVDAVEVKMDMKVAPAYRKYPREKSFRAGLIGPGIYVGNKGIDAMMGIGVEGEYFFFENLSAGLRIKVATDFKSDPKPNAILSFVPQARYVFDFENHPRWSLYVQAGVGLALIDGGNVAADIAIPGGGFWWQWNEKASVGLDASLHILARSNTAVAFFAGPAFRYQF